MALALSTPLVRAFEASTCLPLLNAVVACHNEETLAKGPFTDGKANRCCAMMSMEASASCGGADALASFFQSWPAFTDSFSASSISFTNTVSLYLTCGVAQAIFGAPVPSVVACGTSFSNLLTCIQEGLPTGTTGVPETYDATMDRCCSLVQPVAGACEGQFFDSVVKPQLMPLNRVDTVYMFGGDVTTKFRVTWGEPSATNPGVTTVELPSSATAVQILTAIQVAIDTVRPASVEAFSVTYRDSEVRAGGDDIGKTFDLVYPSAVTHDNAIHISSVGPMNNVLARPAVTGGSLTLQQDAALLLLDRSSISVTGGSVRMRGDAPKRQCPVVPVAVCDGVLSRAFQCARAHLVSPLESFTASSVCGGAIGKSVSELCRGYRWREKLQTIGAALAGVTDALTVPDTLARVLEVVAASSSKPKQCASGEQPVATVPTLRATSDGRLLTADACGTAGRTASGFDCDLTQQPLVVCGVTHHFLVVPPAGTPSTLQPASAQGCPVSGTGSSTTAATRT